MKDHPLAELFPLMTEHEIVELAEDIRAHGQLAPVTMLDGKILDGRNRARACKLIGLDPKTREFKDGDALDFVLSVNLHRRHLTESQRAMVAAKLASFPLGANQHSGSANLPTLPTNTETAAKLSVSPRLVRDAKIVATSKAQTRAVESGEKTVHAAVREIKAKAAAKEIRRDTTGYAIPDELWPLWDRRGEVQEILTSIGRARGSLRAIMESMKETGDDPLYVHANVSGTYGRLNDAWTMISMALPHSVCAMCQGRAADTCKLCKGSGFIPKHTYENALPEELRRIREKSCIK